MARVSTYLNFMGNTEEAFTFYKTVFKTEFEGIQYMKDVPADPSQPALPDDEKNKVMHVMLPITAGHILMGTDLLESMGHELKLGNNVSINLEPDDLAEAKRLFTELSAGGEVEMPLKKMFWGDHFAAFTDKFGIKWMINCADTAAA